MGGKSSKEPGLKRGGSFRRSQKSSFQRIQKKLDKVTKDIDAFNGTSQDDKYHKIKKHLTEIINSLEEISTTVKDKHKETYQSILEKCFEELNKLDSKLDSPVDQENGAGPSTSLAPEAHPSTSPIPQSPSILSSPMSTSPLSERSYQSVQVNLVRLSAEEQAKKNRKNQIIKEETGSTSSQEAPNKEQLLNDAMEMLHQTRKQIETLEGEINMYKWDKNDALYGYIKETLTKILIKIDNMETYGNIQIKHERKLALQRAQECLKLLGEGTPRMPKSQRLTSVIPKNVLSEMRNSTRFKSLEKQNKPTVVEVDGSPKTSKQVTFEINVNDELREELYKIIHDRIEEASSEPGNGKKKLTKSEDKDDNRPHEKRGMVESFANTDSEDEFDFVNVDGESDEKEKKTPVLVTSF